MFFFFFFFNVATSHGGSLFLFGSKHVYQMVLFVVFVTLLIVSIFRSGWIFIFSIFLSMSFHDCFETGVHRLIRLRARTFFFSRSSFLLARINARPQIFHSSPGAPNHLPKSAQWQFFWLALLTTVPQLSELKRKPKNVDEM